MCSVLLFPLQHLAFSGAYFYFILPFSFFPLSLPQSWMVLVRPHITVGGGGGGPGS